MNQWVLPESAVVGGVTYPIHADYRDILDIFKCLNDPNYPEYIRWRIAIALFFDGEIPSKDFRAAAEYLSDFICCGLREDKPVPKLLDWEQDARIIISDVNRVAGTEIRSLPFLHWWTFVSYFNAIGDGQLSTLVSIRDKLRRGKPLEKWENEYYRRNKEQVDMKERYSDAEIAERERLNKLLEA